MTNSGTPATAPDASSGEATSGAAISLQPVAPAERVFGWWNQASLWFVLGVGLLVIQAGTYLTPMVGLRDSFLAVIVGSVIGSGILAWTARTACRTGLSTAGLMSRVFGLRFAKLPIVLNVLQLAGWTMFEIVILRDAIRTIGLHLGASGWASPTATVVITLACGGGLALLLLVAPMVDLVKHVVGRYDMPLALAGLAWLSWQYGTHVLARGSAVGSVVPHGSLFAAVDLVIAMPVSWLPVVSDYARHARLKPGGLRKTMSATWLSYTLANIWGYSLGVLVAATAPNDSSLVTGIAVIQGGLAALGLMLLHEFSNLYGGAYAATVSGDSALPRLGSRQWKILIAVACTVGALLLPIRNMQPFLFLLSSIFVPLFGVILGRVGFAQAERVPHESKLIDVNAVVAWLAGIAAYQLLAHLAPAVGSTVPTLVLTLILGWLSRRKARHPGARPATSA